MSLTDQLTGLFSKRHKNNNPENPKLKPVSVKKYIRDLQLLAKDMDVDFVNLNFLKEPSKVFKAIENLSPTVKASRIVPVLIVTQELPELKEFHEEYAKLHKSVMQPIKDRVKNGIQSEKTQKNMVEWSEIQAIVKEHKKSAEKIYKKLSVLERKPSATELKTIRKYVMAMLVAGDKDLPPRRNEYGDVEVIKNESYKKLKEERKKNNYLVLGTKPFFHFANYKTSDVTGVVDIPVPASVMKVLRKWISLQDSKYLFSNLKGEPLGFADFGMLLRGVFSLPTKNIGTNILRHAYITNYVGPVHEEHKELALKMGHDVNMQKGYIDNSED
tara:strand:- start:163 stop:1149 length:987 start_codon:yes stop_codon:yes gene_type:complete